MVESSENLVDIETNDALCEDIYDLLSHHNCLANHKISFALSLLAQRIRTMPDIFYADRHISNQVSYILDIMSLLTGPANLSSLHSVRNSAPTRKSGIVEELEKLLSGNPVLMCDAWSRVSGKYQAGQQPIWSF